MVNSNQLTVEDPLFDGHLFEVAVEFLLAGLAGASDVYELRGRGGFAGGPGGVGRVPRAPRLRWPALNHLRVSHGRRAGAQLFDGMSEIQKSHRKSYEVMMSYGYKNVQVGRKSGTSGA